MRKNRELLWMLLLLCWGSISSFAQTGGFNPENPPEPMLQYRVTVNSTPGDVAYTSGEGKYNAGATITIGTSSSNTNYVFDHWLKDGERIEGEAAFNYVVEAKNVVFTAVYRYNPTNPPEPTVINAYRLYLTPSPQGICSFNITSGEKREVGNSIWLKANGSQGFEFLGWYDGDELVNSQSGFYYTMPGRDVTLIAKYTYNPGNPGEPEGNQEGVDNQETPVTSISISQTTATLEGGETVKLIATVNEDASNKNIIWTSADSNVASVRADGTVLGLHVGTTTITGTSEANPELTVTCTVTVTSNMPIPTPFEFYYNAENYDVNTHSIPNHPLANLKDASLVLSENIPELIDNELLRINNICCGNIDLWANDSGESGNHFYRSGEDCMTIVCKVTPNYDYGSNTFGFICNREWDYNYMWRIGDHGRMFLHTGDAYDESRSMAIPNNEPQILAVRVDGKNNYILLQNLTTGESLRVNQVNWGGSGNIFRLFRSNCYGEECFLGDFYWVYYSFELLTDEQMRVFTDNFLLGDVNADGVVDISDYISMANYIHGNVAEGFVFRAGDIDGNGSIDISDYIGVTNIIHTGSPSGNSQAGAKSAVSSSDETQMQDPQ